MWHPIFEHTGSVSFENLSMLCHVSTHEDPVYLGDSLESCYEAVAKVADYWLDVLYSKAGTEPTTSCAFLV